MIRVLGAILLVLACVGTANAQSSDWRAIDKSDALTDAAIREVCATQAGYDFCLSFFEDGIYAKLTSPSEIFSSARYPALRVDKLSPWRQVDGPVFGAELAYQKKYGKLLVPRKYEPQVLVWRVNIPSQSGVWTEEVPVLIREMAGGQQLLVRAELIGGRNVDLFYSLASFCDAAAKVYAKQAPPLDCTSLVPASPVPQ